MRSTRSAKRFVRGVYEIGGRRAFDARVASAREPADGRRAERTRALARAGRRRTGVNPRPARSTISRRAARRVVVGCSGGADSLALLALACEHGLDVHAVYVDHGLRAGTGHDARRCRDAAARFGARVARRARRRRARAEPRSPGARRALRRARSGCAPRSAPRRSSSRTRATTRPRRCCCRCCAGAATTGLAGMARAARVRAPAAARRRRRETHELCARLGLAPVHDPMNDELHHRRVWLRREVIPRLERGRRPRSRRGARPPGRAAARRRRAPRRARRASTNPTTRPRSPRCRARSAGGSSGAGWRRPRRPSVATVERVLAVARGDARAAELPGGDRIERVARPARAGRRATATTSPATRRARSCPGGPASAASRSRPGSSTVRRRRGPTAATRAVCDADRVPASVVVRGAAAGRAVPAARPERVEARCTTRWPRPASPRAGGRPRRWWPATEPVWVVGYRIDHRVRVTPVPDVSSG